MATDRSRFANSPGAAACRATLRWVRGLARLGALLALGPVCLGVQGAEALPAVEAPDGSGQVSDVAARPRLLVLTDIGGDPDDRQSMIRLLLYANEFEIEGLVASASGTPGELKERVTQPRLIRELVEAYGGVRANLANHAPGYPPTERLLDRIKNGRYRDAHDTVGGVTDARATVSRWRPVFQADLQARMDWCTTGAFTEANHPPVAVLNGDDSRRVLRVPARPGSAVSLSAGGSRDPDRDALSYRWWIYPEPSQPRKGLRLVNSEGPQTSLTAPAAGEAATVHVVLEVRDDGQPNLTALRRAVVEIRP